VVATVRGFVDADMASRELLPLLAKPEISLLPLALLDLTGVEGTSFPSDFVRVAARKAVGEIDPGLTVPDPKMAIVATRDELFGLGRMYGLLREGRVEINVFRGLVEAERWLGLPADYALFLEPVAS
jgi:hypothetical protein